MGKGGSNCNAALEILESCALVDEIQHPQKNPNLRVSHISLFIYVLQLRQSAKGNLETKGIKIVTHLLSNKTRICFEPLI